MVVEYLKGYSRCRRYDVQPGSLKGDTGEPMKAIWFDECQLELVETTKLSRETTARFKYALGTKAKDRISGFQGVITAHSEYLNGSVRYTIEADTLDKDGKVRDGETFDELMLDPIETPKEERVNPGRKGGPAPNPPKM